MVEGVSWSKLFGYRDQIHNRYPEIWDLKVLRKRFPLMVKNIWEGEKVPDIGASNLNLEGRLKRYYPNLIYKPMDVIPVAFGKRKTSMTCFRLNWSLKI